MQPAAILIDHGHFQYNTIMLGFAAASICNLITHHPFRYVLLIIKEKL